MRRFPQTFWCTVILLSISAFGVAWNKTGQAATHHDKVQAPKISILNFRVADVSSGDVQVTVDYTYPGANVDKVLIHASPTEEGGSWDGMKSESVEVPVQTGTHTVTLGIAKRSTGPVFTSVEVRVCISNPGGALLCKDFPHKKTWRNSAAQLCSISGNLVGRLEGQSYPDHSGPPSTVRLRYMIAELPNGERVNAPVTNGKYTFSNLLDDVHYKVFPDRFESAPRQITVQCRGNTQHRANFRIIRPTPEG